MPRQLRSRSEPLNVDAIVDAAGELIEDEGLAALSMRRLGTRLGVDPMAVYHHVASKRELLSLVMARVVGSMRVPDADQPWETRLRGWATAYWEVVVAHRDLIAAGLADPVVAAGGIPLVRPLTEAVAGSGLPERLVEPTVWLVVDFVHGAGLGAGAPSRHGDDDLAPLARAFAAGLDTIVAGIAARV